MPSPLPVSTPPKGRLWQFSGGCVLGLLAALFTAWVFRVEEVLENEEKRFFLMLAWVLVMVMIEGLSRPRRRALSIGALLGYVPLLVVLSIYPV